MKRLLFGLLIIGISILLVNNIGFCVSCSDTDGGVQYFEKGTCTDDRGSHEDHCSGIYLHEFHCGADNTCWVDGPIDCPGLPNEVCYNGRCEIDVDTDNMADKWETENGLDISNGSDGILDNDSDGLSNADEFLRGTDPSKYDTDGDGYSDRQEVDQGTNPLDANDFPKICGRADSNGIYTKGLCTDYIGMHWDICSGKTFVIEYACSAEKKCEATFSIDCNAGPQGTGFVCADGACVQKACSISGGPMKPTCTDNFGTYAQNCSSSNAVNIWSCSNKECARTIVNCITGTGNPSMDEICVDGLCIKEEAAYVCKSGEKKCAGDNLQECAADRKSWSTKETCTHGCNSTSLSCNPAPKICTAGEKRCTGNILEKCKADGSGWETERECEYGCENKTCKAKSSEPICTPDSKLCSGNYLQICSKDGFSWATIQACEYGCDSVKLECKTKSETIPPGKVCVSGDKRCEGDELQKCRADGMGWEKEKECEYGCENKACKQKPGAQICTAGDKRCEGNELQKCREDGFKWENIESCENGCENKACKSKPVCEEEWKCSDWTACAEGKQTRACVDKNDCETAADKPIGEQECEAPVKELPFEIIIGIAVIALGGFGLGLFLKGKKGNKESAKKRI